MRSASCCAVRVLVAGIIALLLWGSTAFSQGPVEILAVHYPPYEFEEPENGLRGFDHEVVLAAFEREGVEAKITYTQWSRAVGLAREGKAAGILSCAESKEREKDFLHSNPISTATLGFLTLDSFLGNPQRLEDAAKYRTGAVLSYVASQQLEEAGIEHDRSRNDEVALRKLKEHRIEMFFSYVEATLYMARPFFTKGELKAFPVDVTDYHLCISKNWPGAEALISAFNRGLAEIRTDGTYEAIHARYR